MLFHIFFDFSCYSIQSSFNHSELVVAHTLLEPASLYILQNKTFLPFFFHNKAMDILISKLDSI